MIFLATQFISLENINLVYSIPSYSIFQLDISDKIIEILFFFLNNNMYTNNMIFVFYQNIYFM